MTQTDDVQNTPDSRVRALLVSGIAHVKAGAHDLGMAAFEDAGKQAADAGLTALAAGAAIDRGWALWLAGDRDQAIPAYEEGAALSREAGDDARLMIALGNLGIAYTDARRHQDADSLYSEYVPLLDDDVDEQVDARLNWSLALEALGRTDEALSQFDEAQRAAEAAGQGAGQVRVYLAQGGMLERTGDAEGAFDLYWKAFDIASEMEAAELVGTVTTTLGDAYTRATDYSKAADCFGEAARAYRYLEDDARLGAALYRHGLALQRVGLIDQALEVWREAEPLFRELGDDRALGECLLEQALAVQDQLSNHGPDLQFTEAVAAFRAAGAAERLSGILLAHAQWCWDRKSDDAARTHVREALDALAAEPNASIETRVRALNAQLLAEAHEFEKAEAELKTALAVAEVMGDAQGVTGVLVRRAYVMARSGASWEDVRAQLFTAGDSAREAGHETAGRYAAETIATEIEERCGRAYTDLLGALDEKNVIVPGPEGESTP